MSLNGLDAAAVIEAHQNALADTGGWFLLKYVNRDTVELLGRGTGGVAETKNKVEQYEEKSPLYGLVQYRRKRIVLKYVPEGTSRLLQVRLAVQFQSVLDAFPHDTVFSFTAPTELVDSALGLSTMLQPSVHSGNLTPSNASGRQNRLNEIREDGEEAAATTVQPKIVIPPARSRQEPPAHAPSRSDLDGLPASALKAKALLAKRKEADLAAADEGRSPASSAITTRPKTPSSSERTATVIATAIAAAAEAAVREEPSLKYLRDGDTTRPLTAPTNTAPTPRFDTVFAKSTSPNSKNKHETASGLQDEAASLNPSKKADVQSLVDSPSGRINHTRHLSEHETNSITQWNEQVAAYTAPAPKIKKKLAPRPHIDPSTRSRTSNTVAALPQSVRASTRSNFGSPSRPDSRQSSKSVPTRFVPIQSQVPPLPTSSYQPPIYRQSDARKPPSIASSAVTDFSSATPEKLRLMKALQLRKRTQLLSNRAASVQSARTQTSYGGEHHGRNVSEISEARSVIPVSTPVPTQTSIDRVARISAEHKSDINSITASPTSATTASMDQSTKPSSYSGVVSGKISTRSFSAETNSSSTPRAEVARGHPLAIKPPYENSEAVSGEDEEVQKLATAEESPIDQAYKRLTGAWTPPIPDTVVQQPTPKPDIASISKSITGVPLALTTENLNVSNRELSAKKSFHSEVSTGSRSKPRRRRGIASMHITASADGSEGSDEESFMEELRNATVQEAKPVSVARTPITPKMRKLSTDKLRDITRVQTTASYRSMKSSPSEAEKSHPGSPRNNSITLPQWPPGNTDDNPVVSLSKKPTLSSGISKRIKALEVLTHRESVQSASPPSPRETSASRTSFSNLMNRASFISQHQAPNASTDKSPPKRLSESKAVQITAFKEDTAPRPLVQRQGEVAEIFSPQRKGETISVTARIVRDRHALPATQFYHDPSVNLHRSPLIVEHERRESESMKPTMPRDHSGVSIDAPPLSPTSERRRFSFSSHKSGATMKQPHTESRTTRMPGNSKENKHVTLNNETSSITEEKRSSRANRLMKRMSGLSSRLGHMSAKKSPSKDRIPPHTILEQSENLQRRESIADSLLQVIDIGDVNVQFPETLLWKRRFLRIDDQGYLIFSPPTDNAHVRMANRKFHLGDIKTPCLPDREREEMAWSICLDLKDGSCIQCACESKRAQREVLKMLLDAHDAYKSLYD